MKTLKELIEEAGWTEKAGQISQNENGAVNRPPMHPMHKVQCFDPAEPDEPCPICKGLGVVKANVEPDDPRFGKLFRCPNAPGNLDAARQHRLRQMSKLAPFADRHFANFTTQNPMYSERQNEALRTALTHSRKFARDLHGWLVLEGGYGTGKTHLAAAVANECLQRGQTVLFITTPDLLDHLRSTYSPGSEVRYDEMFERMRNVFLLVLDDLGVENPSPWAQEKLFQLLNHRYVERMPTVITTNVSIDTLDPRLRSRLQDRGFISHVEIEAPDFRGQGTAENRLLSSLNRYREMTFDTFDVDSMVNAHEARNLIKALSTAQTYARRLDGWLMLTGDFFTGKTHLAAAIAHQSRRSVDVIFATSSELLDHLRNTFSSDSEKSFQMVFDEIRNVRLLVLDDLGAESKREWAQEKLFQIIDYRYVNKLPMVLTTSNGLEGINLRLASRLADDRICHIVHIDVPSFAERLQRRQK